MSLLYPSVPGIRLIHGPSRGLVAKKIPIDTLDRTPEPDEEAYRHEPAEEVAQQLTVGQLKHRALPVALTESIIGLLIRAPADPGDEEVDVKGEVTYEGEEAEEGAKTKKGEEGEAAQGRNARDARADHDVRQDQTRRRAAVRADTFV